MSHTIAFIGLGNMGLPMARNLLAAGHAVRGFDLVAAALEQLAAAGGQIAVSAADAVAGADVVITMLPASKHVEQCYLPAGGILDTAAPGTLLVDCSTIAPDSARRVAEQAAERGFDMIDAPVSGGTAGARDGKLTFMVGGDAAALERARPLLEIMGRAVFHAGGHGAGQAVKVCNNMLLGIQMIGTCEAIRLGIANGLDPKVVSEVMRQSSGHNWVLDVYNPCPGVMEGVPASHDYGGGFGVDLMLKDLGLAEQSALASQASTPMGALARNLFDLHSKNGAGGLDFSSIFRMLGRQDPS